MDDNDQDNGTKTPKTPLEASPGLECPRCGGTWFRVVYTRPNVRAIVRRRECRHCGRRIRTRETPID